MTVPNSSAVIRPLPSLSNKLKASLNSIQHKDQEKDMNLSSNCFGVRNFIIQKQSMLYNICNLGMK